MLEKKESSHRGNKLEFQNNFLSATLTEEGKCEKTNQSPEQLKQGRGRPNTQLAGNVLGKVHLTKKMQQEREIFLGVGAGNSKVSKPSKEALALSAAVGAATTGNNTLQQAWNTTGFLPQTISSTGQKNSVKDFEYLKFLNDTILKDDVLDKFMQKAGEIEMAAGPQAISPRKKQQQMTPLERIQSEFKRNPHRFHTCTRFEVFFQKQTNKRNSLKSKEVRD